MKSLGVVFASSLAFILVVGVGCGGGATSYSLLATSDHFTQTNSSFSNKLDIMFVINDEPSMSSHQAKLVTSFATFMNLFQAKGFDFKISVVSPSGYLADPTLNGYDPVNVDAADFNDYNGTVYSGMYVITPTDVNLFSNFAINAKPAKNTAGQDGRAFSGFRQALQSTRPINTGFLRSDSFLAVVLVSNQEDFSGNGRCKGCNNSGRYNAPTLDPVSTYVDFLNTATGSTGASARYNVSAMTQSAAPCQGGTNMTRIMELTTLTNGVLGDICQADFGASMAQMSDKIAMLSSQFYLKNTPVVNSISVRVNGMQVVNDAVNGWTYSSTANSIMFHGSAIPSEGDSIDVVFDPVTLSF